MSRLLSALLFLVAISGCSPAPPKVPKSFTQKPTVKLRRFESAPYQINKDTVVFRLTMWIDNTSDAEVKDISVRMNVAQDSPENIVYSSPPVVIDQFVNPPMLHTGSLLGHTRAAWISRPFEIPVDLWRVNAYFMGEIVAVHGVDHPEDFRDKGHLLNFMQSQPSQKVIDTILSDTKILKTYRNQNLTLADFALMGCDVSVVKAMESHGQKLDAKPTHDFTLLNFAARSGRVENVKYALERVKNVNLAPATGETALMDAAWLGREEVVQYLLDHGADPNMADQGGQRAITFAFLGGNLNVITLLTKGGADVNYVEDLGIGPAHRATDFTHLEETYKELKLNPNFCDPRTGTTPMFYAISRGNLEAAAKLVKLGADLKHKDIKGRDAFEIARMSTTLQTDQFLRDALHAEGVAGY